MELSDDCSSFDATLLNYIYFYIYKYVVFIIISLLLYKLAFCARLVLTKCVCCVFVFLLLPLSHDTQLLFSFFLYIHLTQSAHS